MVGRDLGVELEVDDWHLAVGRHESRGPTRDDEELLSQGLQSDQVCVLVTPTLAIPDGSRVPEARAVVVVVAGEQQALNPNQYETL